MYPHQLLRILYAWAVPPNEIGIALLAQSSCFRSNRWDVEGTSRWSQDRWAAPTSIAHSCGTPSPSQDLRTTHWSAPYLTANKPTLRLHLNKGSKSSTNCFKHILSHIYYRSESSLHSITLGRYGVVDISTPSPPATTDVSPLSWPRNDLLLLSMNPLNHLSFAMTSIAWLLVSIDPVGLLRASYTTARLASSFTSSADEEQLMLLLLLLLDLYDYRMVIALPRCAVTFVKSVKDIAARFASIKASRSTFFDSSLEAREKNSIAVGTSFLAIEFDASINRESVARDVKSIP